MSNVPTNLIPTTITQLPEYTGTSTLGYFPYALNGRTFKVQFDVLGQANFVPSTRTVTAGAGLTGGGQLNNNITISLNPSNATPQSLGVASAGSGAQAARDDHVHPAVNLTNTSETQGVLPLGRGGTGVALSPVVGAVIYASGSNLDQTTAGTAGQVLTSAGGLGAPYWATISASGTVTSVAASGGTTGLTFSGSPITTSGTLTLGGTLGVANGGTGATTLTSNAILKGNGTSAVSASSITDNGTVVTIAEQLTLSAPNTSAPAWTTSGINLIQSAATFTDTSSTGTVADVRVNNFAAQTVAATNTLTATNLYGTYFTDPVAGTNVTATSRFAVGADSLRVSGQVAFLATTANISFDNQTSGTFTVGAANGTGTITIGRSTGTQTTNIQAGTTASGSTKTVNIGTNGASGSTTNITVGSATSGATSSITANGQVTLAPIGGSRAAWTTSGIGLVQSAATWTDTSSTGTVADVRVNNFAAQTVAASNVITATLLFGNYFAAPVAGTNVTATRSFAVGVDSLYVNGSVSMTPATAGNTIVIGAASQTGAITLGQSTASQTTNIQAGVTASGSTKTVNIGTGGASGSTTTISIGSAVSGATSTITLNGSVKPLTAAVTSGATITPTADTTNQYNVTALAVGATFAAPSGTPVDGQKLMIRIKDNGTGQTLAWNAIYRVVGSVLPTTTTANKTIYVGCIYNSADTKWDVVAVASEA